MSRRGWCLAEPVTVADTAVGSAKEQLTQVHGCLATTVVAVSGGRSLLNCRVVFSWALACRQKTTLQQLVSWGNWYSSELSTTVIAACCLLLVAQIVALSMLQWSGPPSVLPRCLCTTPMLVSDSPAVLPGAKNGMIYVFHTTAVLGLVSASDHYRTARKGSTRK